MLVLGVSAALMISSVSRAAEAVSRPCEGNKTQNIDDYLETSNSSRRLDIYELVPRDFEIIPEIVEYAPKKIAPFRRVPSDAARVVFGEGQFAMVVSSCRVVDPHGNVWIATRDNGVLSYTKPEYLEPTSKSLP